MAVDTARPVVEAGRVRRLWAAPLWAHAAVLALLLAVLFPLMHPTSAFTSDEGAYALQVKALDHGSWTYDYRAAPLDPGGAAFPVILSDSGPSGSYPYVKHPAYPLLLQASTRLVGETPGLHLLNLLGVVSAAVAAWLLAGELDPRLRRPAFWLAAGGPVLVNGFLIWAHAPSAAVAGLAVAGAARMARRGITPWVAAGTTAALVGGVLLRSEGLLLAGALAMALAAVRIRRTRRLPPGVGAFALVAGPALVAAVAERRWTRWIVGGTYTAAAGQVGAASSFLSARVSGAWHELFQAHFIERAAAVPVLAALVVVAGVGFVALRWWRPWSTRLLAAPILLAVGFLVLRLVLQPYEPVTGLIPAWPLAVLGLLLFRWRGGGPVAGLLGITLVVFTVAILATQYAEGGGAEWGGRYLSPALVPLAVLAVAGLAAAVDRAPPASRRRVVALLAGFGVAGAVFSVATAGALRAREDRIVSAVARHPSPVMLTDARGLPRLAWRDDGRLTWMLADDAALPALLRSLRAQGVPQVTVVVSSEFPLDALTAYPVLTEQDEPALAGSGIRAVVATGG